MTHRTHNFNAGPGALPLPVLEQVRDELVDFRGAGMSLLEMSHRGKVYDRIHNEAMADIRALLGLGDDFSVLFMGGGARSQFAFVAMNLLGKGPGGGVGAYVNTGQWSKTAIAEATAAGVGEIRTVWSSAETGFDRVPGPGEFPAAPEGAAYLHFTSNNTVVGTEFLYDPAPPAAGAGAVLVCDMSSDLMSRRIDPRGYGLIYAGAQKNVGPAGVTIVLARKDVVDRSAKLTLPEPFSYAKMAREASLLNTPPVFAIYVVGLVCKRLLATGGLDAAEAAAKDKASRLYAAIDGSGGFYRGHSRPDSRSRMNVTFRAPSEDLEARFAEQASAAGMDGLKGHRSVGGLRASIYNAVPLESVEALAGFMGDFAQRNG